ncbi:MAG: hypothetical protein IJK08_03055 [Prevotella sp.]|nr:hypothetical protein [Prevotella sp.]
MTLRELILSVDAGNFADCQLFQELLTVKPEYGSGRTIEVKQMDGQVAVTNVHVGSLSDILTYRIFVSPELNITKNQLLDAILREMSADGFTDAEQTSFWTEMTNLQKAKIVR